MRWLFASFAEDLAVRDSVKCRSLIQSQWFQQRWGNRFQLLSDQNLKTAFANDKTGVRTATSMRSGTGLRADVVAADDPHPIQTIESDDVRQTVVDAWRTVFSQRGSNPAESAFVIVMQRLHESDVVGDLLEREGIEHDGGEWTHLKIPQEYEGAKIYTTVPKMAEDARIDPSTGKPELWDDPRTEPGELLWRHRIDDKAIAQLKISLGESAYAGQQQQRPSPAGGGMFKDIWLSNTYDALPTMTHVVQTVDSAFKTGVQNDWSVIASWGTDGANFYLIDIRRGKWIFPELYTNIVDAYTFAPHRPRSVLIEDTAAGQSVIQMLKVNTQIPVIPIKVTASKIARASAITPIFEAGKVFVPKKAPWLDAWRHEHSSFPGGAHDDCVDTSIMAVDRLSRGAKTDVKKWLSGTFGMNIK